MTACGNWSLLGCAWLGLGVIIWNTIVFVTLAIVTMADQADEDDS